MYTQKPIADWLLRKHGISLLLCIFCCSSLFAQPNPDFARIQRLIPQMMDSAGIPGLSIAVVQEGEISWLKGFGIRHNDQQSLVQDHTVFEAASLSKPLFSYLVMQLVDKGKLDLDIPLIAYASQSYLEDKFFHRPMTDKQVGLLTARMVLSHSSGFPNWRTRGEALAISFRPGSKFQYSGEGFMMLQSVVEYIMQKSLSKLARSYVFDPLGMENSSFIWQEAFKDHMAYGHNAAGEVAEIRKTNRPAAAYSLLTTAEDYGIFMEALMAGTGLEDASHQAMLKKLIATPYGQSEDFGWGLGVGVQHTKMGKGNWQWGDNEIFKSFMFMLPEEKFAWVFLTNSENGLSIGKKLSELLMGQGLSNFSYLDYEQYQSPVFLLGQALMNHKHEDPGILLQQTSLSLLSEQAEFEEQELNQLGYRLLDLDKTEEAIAVFKMNLELHPDSWNAYDSLGEAFWLNGDASPAIQHYQRSLQINPENDNGRKMLDKIRKD